MVRESAIALAARGVTPTPSGWIRGYLSINYGIPRVDNTERLPAKISAVAATLSGSVGARPAQLDRLARQALEHSVSADTPTYPPWSALDQESRWVT